MQPQRLEALRRQTEATLKVPLATSRLAIGTRIWHVTAVQNQDALLDAATELEHFPYGFLLWEAAVALARWLAQHPHLVAGKRVLELGCGVGLTGLVAQSLGAEVWQTDHQPGAFALARLNAAQNGLAEIPSFLADWRVWNHSERYEVLLGADICYERAMHFHLEQVFRQCLAPGGLLLCADPIRPQSWDFIKQLEKSGWQANLETLWVTLHEEGREPKAVEVALWALGVRQ